MDKLDHALVVVNRWALILILAAMSIIIFTNVALRYLTSNSLDWAEEVARHLMIWLTFIGAGMVLRYGGHIAVESLQDAVPARIAQAMRVLVALMLLAFGGFMIWYGILYMERTQFQTTAATQIPFSYVYAAMPIGGVLMILHFLAVIRGYVSGRRFDSGGDDEFDANASASL